MFDAPRERMSFGDKECRVVTSLRLHTTVVQKHGLECSLGKLPSSIIGFVSFPGPAQFLITCSTSLVPRPHPRGEGLVTFG